MGGFNLKEPANKPIVTQSLAARILGCWHLKISRPITTEKITYRYCTKCGMRQKYDMKKFKSVGSFYSPRIKENLHFV